MVERASVGRAAAGDSTAPFVPEGESFLLFVDEHTPPGDAVAAWVEFAGKPCVVVAADASHDWCLLVAFENHADATQRGVRLHEGEVLAMALRTFAWWPRGLAPARPSRRPRSAASLPRVEGVGDLLDFPTGKWLPSSVGRASFLTLGWDGDAEPLVNLGQEAVPFSGLVTAGRLGPDETMSHILRVGQLARMTAAVLGHAWDNCKAIEWAARTHDVGNLAVACSILSKPGPLESEELGILREHTRIGSRLLADSPMEWSGLASEIALCHHEKWDGTGYPRGLRREEIPMAARIVAVADAFDSASHPRVERQAASMCDAVCVVLSGSGTHFDPQVVDAFIEAIAREREPPQVLPSPTGSLDPA